MSSSRLVTIIVLVPRRVRRRRPARKVSTALTPSRPARKAQALRPAESHLEALLERVHRKHPGRLWSVRELAERGFVLAEDCRRLGYALSAAIRAGGRVGRFVLVRVTTDRDGAVYRADAVTSAVSSGDSPGGPADDRA